MKIKSICAILAALLLLSSASACSLRRTDREDGTAEDGTAEDGTAEDGTDTETNATTGDPESPDSSESTTDVETETDPLPSLTVPSYEDIGLFSLLTGKDERYDTAFDFTDTATSLSDLRANSALTFTTNGTIGKDADGISASASVWNAVGFSKKLTEAYATEATLYNHGTTTSVTSSVMYGARLTDPGHLFIDSGIWVTVNGGNAYLIVHNVFTAPLALRADFNAAEGVAVCFEDDGDVIRVLVADELLATVTVDDQTGRIKAHSAEGRLLASAVTDRVARGDSLGYVRAMQHFAHSSVASISLTTGEIQPYTADGSVTALRGGLSYFFRDKTQYKCDTPVILNNGVILADAKAVAALFGFSYAATDKTVTLTRDGATLTFTEGQSAVDLNGTSHPFPTVVRRGDTLLLAANYVARWMGYAVCPGDNTAYFIDHQNNLTTERIQTMKDRFDLYRDVVYNHDDVTADQTGVGLYEKTPYEDRLVGIAYSTWHYSTVTRWGKDTWDLPLDGPYASDDPNVIRRHAIQLRDAGVDFVFVDWTNNTCYDPATMRDERPDFRMIEEATDLLFEIWSTVEGAPKICIFAGPGHAGPENVINGNHQSKVDQIWRDYVEKYPDLYFSYKGKPLLMCYGATPNLYGTEPEWTDDRFTVRWATGYVGQQSPLFNKDTLRSYGFWSWEERGAQTYTVVDGRVECITCTASSRAQGKEGEANYIPAYGRNDGMTLKQQFQRANDLGAGIVILVSWNEWATGEQPSPEISKDLEPSRIHGTFYYDLLCEQIKKYKGQLADK